MSRCIGVLAILAWSFVASAQPTVALKIEIDPSPLLDRVVSHPRRAGDDKGSALVEAFYNEVKTTGVILASKTETEVALGNVARPQDLRNSNQRLKEMAAAANVLYGAYVLVSLDQVKVADAPGHFVLKLKARVVSREGEVAVEQKEQTAPVYKTDPDSVLAQFKVLARELVSRLSLAALVAESPARRSVEDFSHLSGADVPRSVTPTSPPPMPPLEVRVETPFTHSREVGYSALGVGMVAAVAGVIVFAAAPVIQTDSYGYVLADYVGSYARARTMRGVGVGLMVGGGVAAGAGLLMALLSSSHSTALRASAVPVQGGGVLVLGGSFR